MSARPTSALLLAACAALPGCSIFSPMPLLELAKAGGAAAAGVIATAPSEARDTVLHERGMPLQVCVVYDPRTPDPDIAPALQGELQALAIDSRLYAAGALPSDCRSVLSYTAAIEWGVPPLADGYAPYLRAATLTLRDGAGRVLASSNYALDGLFQSGKWASSRSKLAPVVAAIVSSIPG